MSEAMLTISEAVFSAAVKAATRQGFEAGWKERGKGDVALVSALPLSGLGKELALTAIRSLDSLDGGDGE